jgi:hypothetical protein
MAGFHKLYVVGGEGGFMGADGVNPIDYILAVGTSDRMWFEVRDFRPRQRIAAVQATVPAGPDDPNALVDAVLAFDLGRFADCPSFAEVRDQRDGVERLDFDRGLNIPPAWAKLREEARPIFTRMGIWEADLREVRQNVR